MLITQSTLKKDLHLFLWFGLDPSWLNISMPKLFTLHMQSKQFLEKKMKIYNVNVIWLKINQLLHNKTLWKTEIDKIIYFWDRNYRSAFCPKMYTPGQVVADQLCIIFRLCKVHWADHLVKFGFLLPPMTYGIVFNRALT